MIIIYKNSDYLCLGEFIFSFGRVEGASNKILEEARLRRFLLEIEYLIGFLFFWDADFDAITMK